ncbi:MAG: M48 family metalloprotease [Deltaproteobacteria bacterium]|nr:M48 family metalloprotease [Deltaproteobacteria bacterium]
MYGNIVYFIIVVLIYTTYYPPEEPYFGPVETLIIFSAFLAIFVITTKSAFRNISKKIEGRYSPAIHGQFDRLFNRQAIMAIVIFSLNLYALNLKLFLMDIPFVSASPTIMGLLFVALFMGYLAIIWWEAHPCYRRLFQARVSRRSYLFSNILFNFPVILPWIFISALAEIINLIPLKVSSDLLAKPEGQILFFSCFLAALIVVAPSLIKFFWRCRPLPQGAQRKRIEDICKKASLAYRGILNWPLFEGKLLTAGIMGLVKRFRYILVTESLLQILDPDEVDAVMAHEIGHIKRRHLVFYLVFFLGFIVLSYSTFDLILYAILYGNLALPVLHYHGGEPSAVVSILFAAAMALTFVIYFRFIFGYFMRNCERQADLYAFKLLGTGSGLVSSLRKIATYSGQSHDRPCWHHFSIRERIDFLTKCETDRDLIARHDRKLQRSMMVFVAGLVCAGYLGYAINFGQMGKSLNRYFVEKVVTEKLKQSPANAELYTILASVCYQNKEYAKAIAAYEKAIALAPDDAEAFNNLAWLYATCEEIEYRNPPKALFYAKQAVALKPVPHILDTLAESYYRNGLYQKAIITIREALAKNPEDRDYYESQLRKFQKAKAG